MTDERYMERLARFKENERPEAVLVIEGKPELTKIVVAWTCMDVRRAAEVSEPAGGSDSEVWEWLWHNAEYSRSELIAKSGIPLSLAGLENKMMTLVGNRVLYPDGTVNSYVQRYLREQVVKLFDSKLQRPAKRK